MLTYQGKEREKMGMNGVGLLCEYMGEERNGKMEDHIAIQQRQQQQEQDP